MHCSHKVHRDSPSRQGRLAEVLDFSRLASAPAGFCSSWTHPARTARRPQPRRAAMNFLNSSARPTGPHSTPDVSRAPLSELSMYTERPSGEISLEEFEKYALDRLRVLKAIEEAKLRSKSEDDIQADATKLFAKLMTCSSRQESGRKDVTSHHILRLAYCRTAELRAWLLTHEAALFKARFKALSQAQQAECFASMELPYRPISDDEAEGLADELAAVALALGDRDGHNRIKRGLGSGAAAGRRGQADAAMLPDIPGGKPAGGRLVFYRVPFAAVPDLVGGRRVLLRGGQAYVAEDQVYSLVVGAFRARLSAGLAEAARAWGAFSAAEADRLAPLMDSLPNRSVAASEGRKLPVGSISAAQVPGLVAAGHFPLCMSVMASRLASEHHLKHWGLQQLSLFLKAIGLPLEQAMLFFRQQFAPRTPGDKFTKEYGYNIRYNYGQEGKRQDWSEWSCVKIINQEVGGSCAAPCECNGGCPYKTFEPAQLRAALTRLNCNERVIRDVLDKVRGKHYQLACGLAFEGITGSPQDSGINKPSEYYAASIEAAAARSKAAGDAAGAAQQQATQQQQQQQQQQGPAGGGPPPATPLGHGAGSRLAGAGSAAAAAAMPMQA